MALVLSLLQTGSLASALAARRREGRERPRGRSGCATTEEEERRMRFVYLMVSVLPTMAVVTLAWCVLRAISVRVVWRERAVRRLDDEPA